MGSKAVQAFFVTVALFMIVIFAIGGFDTIGDMVRLLIILLTFGLTLGFVKEGFFK